MRRPRPEPSRLNLIVGSADRFLVTARGDTLVVRGGRAVISSRVVLGLTDFLRRSQGNVRLRLAITQDGGDVVSLLDRDGFGWAEHLAAPASSDWCKCGPLRERRP